MPEPVRIYPPAAPDPPPRKPLRRTYSAEEAAAILGISPGSVYDRMRSGELEHLKLGSRLVIPRRVIWEMLGEEEPKEE